MLRLGYFPDFNGTDTVLIDGTSQEIKELCKRLGEFVDSGMLALSLDDLVSVSFAHSARLVVISDEKRADSRFIWSCNASSFDATKEKLHALVAASKGHQYFELVGSPAQLMVSIGEYGDEWWQAHG